MRAVAYLSSALISNANERELRGDELGHHLRSTMRRHEITFVPRSRRFEHVVTPPPPRLRGPRTNARVSQNTLWTPPEQKKASCPQRSDLTSEPLQSRTLLVRVDDSRHLHYALCSDHSSIPASRVPGRDMWPVRNGFLRYRSCSYDDVVTFSFTYLWFTTAR